MFMPGVVTGPLTVLCIPGLVLGTACPDYDGYRCQQRTNGETRQRTSIP